MKRDVRSRCERPSASTADSRSTGAAVRLHLLGGAERSRRVHPSAARAGSLPRVERPPPADADRHLRLPRGGASGDLVEHRAHERRSDARLALLLRRERARDAKL